MILGCTEVFLDEDKTPERRFLVEASGNEGMSDVMRLCGTIPKPNQDRGIGKWHGWTVNHINCTCTQPGVFVVTVGYAPPAVIVAEASDEPQFPPYRGSVGKQADGSFILSPKAFYYLRETWLHRGRNSIIGPQERDRYLDEFCGVLVEETGYGGEEYT